MAKKEYKYPKNWFKYNLIAVPTDFACGNCSACVFRNAPKYCENMACTYIDMSPNSDYIESVYWVSRGTHANVATWSELRQFFDTTPKQRIRDISNDIVSKTILKKLEKTAKRK